jgi:hypothetical protein
MKRGCSMRINRPAGISQIILRSPTDFVSDGQLETGKVSAEDSREKDNLRQVRRLHHPRPILQASIQSTLASLSHCRRRTGKYGCSWHRYQRTASSDEGVNGLGIDSFMDIQSNQWKAQSISELSTKRLVSM